MITTTELYAFLGEELAERVMDRAIAYHGYKHPEDAVKLASLGRILAEDNEALKDGVAALEERLGSLERMTAELRSRGVGDVTTEPLNPWKWWKDLEIVPEYLPPFPRPNEEPILVVKWRNLYLRYSKGPKQGHFWDVYPDDYHTFELAMRAIQTAPLPPPVQHALEMAELAKDGVVTIQKPTKGF